MFTSAFPIVSTPDMGRALAFYRDLLGGKVTYQFPPSGDPGYVAHLRAAGTVITEEPTTQPWGERIARALDPDGNEIIIGQPAPPDTDPESSR